MEYEQPQLIDIGSCGLHRIHRAFKTSTESTDWELKKVFKGYLLHDSPAGGDNFISLTGLDNFPLLFCAIRWMKDWKIADRLIDIRIM